MKKAQTAAIAAKLMIAIAIILAIVFINSCKRETPGTTEQPGNLIKPHIADCGPGYHWDFNLGQCVPNCQNGYVYCPALGYCVPNGSCTTTGGNDIDRFRTSADFISFTNSNPVIASKIDYRGAKVRNDYNKLYGGYLKSIHFPVIETTGDTSAVVIGIPLTSDNATNYLIFYQNNQLLTKDSQGNYYGTIQADLYNTTASYTAQFNSSFELVSDTLVTGPRWISNNSCSTCRLVWPSWTCIEEAREYFFATCGCKTLCAISDRFGYGSCTLGTFMGAAAFCAAHNNRPHT